VVIKCVNSGKEIQVPHFLKIEHPVLEDHFVWQKMARRIEKYIISQAVGASSDQRSETGCDLELLNFADMKTIVTQTDSRIPEFHLFRLAYKWCECQRRWFLKQHLSLIDFGGIDVEQQSHLVEIEPLLRSSDVAEALWCPPQKRDNSNEEAAAFVEKFALLRQITAESILQSTDEMFQLFLSSIADNKHKLDRLDEHIVALVDYLRQGDSSKFDLFRILCQFNNLWHKYVLSELVKEVDFARLTPRQRKAAVVDLEPLDRQQVFRVENALWQSRILSAADVGILQGQLGANLHRWVMYYADDQCDQSRWKQLNDIMQTDVFKMIVFRLVVDGREWVIAVCLAEKLMLRDTVAVSASHKFRTRVYVSVHDERNDSCLTPLADNYLLALDGHRLQIFEENAARNRTQTFVCLMNLDDSTTDAVGLSVALNRFDRKSFSQDHNGARITRMEVGRFEVFLNQPSPMVAPAIVVGHYDCYRSPQSSADASPSEDFRYSAKAFPRLDEEPAPSVTDVEEELQRVELKYYELKQKIAMKQAVENELEDWLMSLQQTSEV